ncbi:mechanosensitive ion channel family protein [Ferruginibacter sp. HRS2-29]|uniref:mechanosensitive ion channel family protein n=1 Tax=Ferruginibacter sp. HRS2-29 TaxID=2487334 RepID=UPI0020CF4F2C|nr:mechanosensitive ion channel domain-containing protein [Ferruginibacter sp. HRS2-29]MCP9752855.1 mechanosensitive ion channel protein MscS [Ferruginibacter sp. HRS2-29]
MMEFLNRIYFDNTVKSYLVVLAVIFFVLAFKRLLSKYVASLIYHMIKRTWKSIEQRQFVELIVKPLGNFMVITVAVVAIDKLNFPAAWNINIYHRPLEILLNKTGYIIVIIAFVKLVVSLVHFISLILQQSSTVDKEHNQLIIFFRDFFKVITYIAGILLLLKVVMNVNIGAFVAGLGIAGAALALAAKESIENIIASFIIFLDKPFFTGDTVKVNAFSGKVERIGLRSTRIRTNDKTLITVPNKQMVDSVVDNLSFRSFRRAEIKLEFSPKTAHDILSKNTEAFKRILAERKELLSSYSVLVTDFTKSGITVTVEFFATPIPLDDFNKIKEGILIELMELVQHSGIELASAQSNITIHTSDPGEDAPSKSSSII